MPLPSECPVAPPERPAGATLTSSTLRCPPFPAPQVSKRTVLLNNALTHACRYRFAHQKIMLGSDKGKEILSMIFANTSPDDQGTSQQGGCTLRLDESSSRHVRCWQFSSGGHRDPCSVDLEYMSAHGRDDQEPDKNVAARRSLRSQELCHGLQSSQVQS